MSLAYEFKVQTLIDEGRTTQEAINEIKNHLASSFRDLPEELIALFLMSCKNQIAQTKDTIKAYFKITKNAPHMFTDRDVDGEELQKAVSVVSSVTIPKRLADNTAIHFFKLIDTNYKNYNWVMVLKLAYMLLYISQRKNPPNELVVVVDMEGTGLMHLTKIQLSATKIFLAFLQEAMPLRLKALHFLNANSFFDKIVAISRAFIKTELFSVIKIHAAGTDLTQFQREFIPVTHLPKDYGGELPCVEELHAIAIQQFRELKPFFEAEEKLFKSFK